MRRRSSEIVDLGDDEYTVGRPHPMIDPRLRNEQHRGAGGDPRRRGDPARRRARLRLASRPGRRARPGHRRGQRRGRRRRPRSGRRRLGLRHAGRPAGPRAPGARLCATPASSSPPSNAGGSCARSRRPACVAAGTPMRERAAASMLFPDGVPCASTSGLAGFAEPLARRRRRGRSTSTGGRRPKAIASSGCCSPGSRTTRTIRSARGSPRPTRRPSSGSSAPSRCWSTSSRPATAIAGLDGPDASSTPARRSPGSGCAARCGARSSARSCSRAGPSTPEEAERWPQRGGDRVRRRATTTARSGRWPASSARRCRSSWSRTPPRGNRAFATLNEGLGKVLRFGAYDETVLDRLRWFRDIARAGAAPDAQRHRAAST